jgi:hypothetical protein
MADDRPAPSRPPKRPEAPSDGSTPKWEKWLATAGRLKTNVKYSRAQLEQRAVEEERQRLAQMEVCDWDGRCYVDVYRRLEKRKGTPKARKEVRALFGGVGEWVCPDSVVNDANRATCPEGCPLNMHAECYRVYRLAMDKLNGGRCPGCQNKYEWNVYNGSDNSHGEEDD